MKYDYAITFACYNSVHYTKTFVDSLIKVGTPLDRVVVVDNGSSDETRDYLLTLPLGGRIYNKSNQACGVAWNQGILHLQAEWSVVMNNDLIVSSQWIEHLIKTAIDKNLSVISPAMIEGELDYDFDAFASESSEKMKKVFRHHTQHAVCVCIHRSVFQEIGYFRANPKLLGFEDTIFFHDLEKSQFQSAINGSVWLHHFGSITQKDMKKKLGKSEKDVLMKVNDRHLLQQGWLERKIAKYKSKKRNEAWRKEELANYGMTLHGERVNHAFNWR
ncbi:MAG: glycosyl transferase [Betaproteobacteria bacterium HGW-Betaproteobacteria-18]|nr:MAG: glycosyl transferase [Betaproteobacteria bacterium HGW-Betaproteobacteria-18]